MTDQQFDSLIAALKTMNSNICAIARKIDAVDSKLSDIDSRLSDIESTVDKFPY